MSAILRDLKQSSIATYRKQISTLLKNVYGKDYMKEADVLIYFKDADPLMEWLKKKKLNTQIAYLTAIVVWISPVERNRALHGYDNMLKYYQKELDNLFKEKDKIDVKKKTAEEEQNWVGWDELLKVRNGYKKALNRRKYKIRSKLKSDDDLELIIKYVIASLYLLHPPRRNVYANTKIVSEREYFNLTESERHSNNYLVVISRNNKFFSFGDYKTAKIYGVKKIKLEKDLNSVMNFWLNINPTKHLLITNKREKMTLNNLSKYLVKVFSPSGKKISSQMLRKIHLTEKFQHIQEDMKNEAEKMGHSVSTQQTKYVKK